MNLISDIKKLQTSSLKKEIDKKLNGFSSFQKKSNHLVFLELCYCLLTANFNAKKAIEIQKNCKDLFLTGFEKEIAVALKNHGHRFPNARAHFIFLAQEHKDNIKTKLKTQNKREWLVKNIKGLGFKEASHFLRNIGFFEYAIIDFHIVDILVKYKVIEKPKTLNKKNYLEIEEKLLFFANKTKTSLGELDLYLWYMETGVIYK